MKMANREEIKTKQCGFSHKYNTHSQSIYYMFKSDGYIKLVDWKGLPNSPYLSIMSMGVESCDSLI